MMCLLIRTKLLLKAECSLSTFSRLLIAKIYGQINSCNDNLINWNFPNAGAYKINTDGLRWKRELRRDCSWRSRKMDRRLLWQYWLVDGYQGWALGYALVLCDERNWEGVLIETDCLTAVKLIQGEISEEHHPDRALIEDCRNMIKDLNTMVKHVLWEANKCADKHAKIEGSQGERLVRMLVPPEDIIEDLRAWPKPATPVKYLTFKYTVCWSSSMKNIVLPLIALCAS